MPSLVRLRLLSGVVTGRYQVGGYRGERKWNGVNGVWCAWWLTIQQRGCQPHGVNVQTLVETFLR